MDEAAEVVMLRGEAGKRGKAELRCRCHGGAEALGELVRRGCEFWEGRKSEEYDFNKMGVSK